MPRRFASGGVYVHRTPCDSYRRRFVSLLCPLLRVWPLSSVLKLLYWLMLFPLLPGNLYPFSFCLSSSFDFMFCQILSNPNTTKSVIRMNQIFLLVIWRIAFCTWYVLRWWLSVRHQSLSYTTPSPPPPHLTTLPPPPAPDPSLSHLWLKRMVPSGWRRMRRLGTVTTWLYSFLDWEKKTSGSQTESTRR